LSADVTTETPVPAGSAMGPPVLEFRTVTKTFTDGTHALDSTSFGVAAGEFVTVVGPSGCGKSTLLRIASGLEQPTTGAVTVDRASLGYVFQDPTLLQWRVAENVRLVGLDGFEDKYPKQLSGGMKMRASLARSLLMEPEVFLFDEPFGAVDEITRERLNDELIGLFQRKGFGALFITHSIYEAVFLSTRVLVMSARPGHIVATFEIPFPYPRSHDLRFESEFAEVAGEVSHALRGAHV
jgi:NitT/TauT family transport system ATP-binding protein